MVAHKKGVLVCSVCKSTNVYTNTNESYGDSLTYLSKKVSEKLNRFVYYPAFFVDENLGLSEVFFAKFHERSKLVLKVEILCGDARNVDIIKFFSQLSFYCKDPILLGYPYGLIDADKFARISNEEASYLKTIFAVKGTKNEMILETFDLHSVLDRISY